ncbi:hypothetical protein AAC387_Pa02g5204 [Persea americana]
MPLSFPNPSSSKPSPLLHPLILRLLLGRGSHSRKCPIRNEALLHIDPYPHPHPESPHLPDFASALVGPITSKSPKNYTNWALNALA